MMLIVVSQAQARYYRTDLKYRVKPVYCDTSGGRLVLDDGNISKTYCRWKAVMDFQYIHDCCTWQGGVLLVSMGKVVCRDGSVSPICSLLESKKHERFQTDHSVELKRDDLLF